MFQEGQLVYLKTLTPDVQQIIEDALETDFEDISFYYLEEDDDYLVLSAETDYKFAVVYCQPQIVIGYQSKAKEIDELLSHITKTITIDMALETKNRALFDAAMKYESERPLPEEKAIEDLYINVVYDESGTLEANIDIDEDF